MSTMKINWGIRIAVLYSGFVILMVTLVTLSMREDFQLVSGDYYQKELRYQEIIDAGKNQAALSRPVILDADASEVAILMPEEFSGRQVKGNIEFFAASDAKRDAVFELDIAGNRQTISRERLYPTHYQVKINWEADGKKYYQETALNLFQK